MKGISSFIATILIIAVTVAAGGIISSWMIHFATTETKTVGSQSDLKIVCSDGGISMSDLKYNCTSSAFSGKIKNTGKIDLGGINLQILYTNATNEKQCLSYSAGTIINDTCSGNLTMAIGEEYAFSLTIGGSNYDKIIAVANCSKDVSYEAESSDVTPQATC